MWENQPSNEEWYRLYEAAMQVKRQASWERMQLPEDETFLVREPRRDGGYIAWADVTMRVPPPEQVAISIVMDLSTLERLKDLPIRRFAMEIDLSVVLSGIQDRGKRPYFPYLLLLVDASSGLALGSQLMKAHPSLEEMWGQVTGVVAQKLADLGTIPEQIRVGSPLLFQLLRPLTERLGLLLTQAEDLPALEATRDELLQVICPRRP